MQTSNIISRQKAKQKIDSTEGRLSDTPFRDPTIRQNFDADSGQVFTEREVPFVKKHRSDWIGECKTPALLEKRHPNEHGARKLVEMAIIQMPNHVRSLNAEHFHNIPWVLADRIWKEIVSIRGESFHSWRTFASAYPDSHEFGNRDYRYLLEIKQFALSPTDYFNGISSYDFKWLVSLRISPKQLSRTVLVNLASIPNLAVLDLSDGQGMIGNDTSPFDERIMRAWAEQARVDQCFSQLRALLFGWQENLSSWIFNYVDSFPSLCQIIMTDCAKIHQRNRPEWEEIAQIHGWGARHAKNSVKTLKPLIDDKKFRLGAVSNCYYVTDSNHTQFSEEPISRNLSRPMLECWLGSPRLWTHIIDDFPRTRTIYFEKFGKSHSTSIQGSVRSVKSPLDHPKRSRETNQRSPGVTSPPSKRGGQIKACPKVNLKSLNDLLGELTS